jgi:tartrate-resistant acid phosphatase type 5
MLMNRRRLIQSATVLWGGATAGVGWAATPKALTFLSTGDWGMSGNFFQRQVGHSMGAWAEHLGSRFVVAVGDNFYDKGVQSVSDPLWKTCYEDIYSAKSLHTPWHAVLGNHDYGGVPQAQIDYSGVSKRWRMPARYYTRTERTPDGSAVDMFFLDTTPMLNGYRNRAEDTPFRANARSQDVAAQLRWLNGALAASRAPWKIAFGHHPVFSGGEHGDTRELVADLKPMFERYGVQAYICGHDHDLQQIDRGVTYVCTGAGATTRKAGSTEGTKFTSAEAGFTAYRLTAERLTIDFIDNKGAVLHTAQISRSRA